MFELQIIIPKADNDNNLFSTTHHAAFEAFVIERFGGITLWAEGIEGSWVDDGTLYKDISRLYGIAVASITEGHKVKEVVEFAKAHYKQEAIFIKYLGLTEIL